MATFWFIIAGTVFVVMALSSSLLRRLPLSTSLVYLVTGYALGAAGMALVEPVTHADQLETLSEVAVLVSLFASGLKLRLSLRDPAWRLPLQLATGAMVATVALVASAAVLLLDLPLGAAIALGAILAPTDPVLASEVQVESPTDTDRLRFGLTGEAGLNDGTAFPFLMLGLGLLGVHPLGTAGWRWLSIDLLWASGAGLVTGWLLGTAIGRLVVHLRRTHREAVGLDDFLALGLIALAHGVAVALAGYGFLAVFAAGLALRRIEARESGDRPPHEVLAQATAAAESRDLATCGEAAPAYMAQAVLGFTEQLERVAEVALMIVLGMMLASTGFAVQGFALSALLFLGIRPLVTWLCSAGTGASHAQRLLIGWFGIRGIGSLYYLLFAITHGLPAQLAEVMVAPVLTVLATSAVVHGISVTPLMSLYSRRRRRHGELAGAVAPSGDVDATLR